MPKLSTTTAKASEAAALDPSPPTTESASFSSSSLFASAASSVGVYAGFYWWILVITAGIAPTLWSSMALCWHLGDCPAAWVCLALSGLYWVSFFCFVSLSLFRPRYLLLLFPFFLLLHCFLLRRMRTHE